MGHIQMPAGPSHAREILALQEPGQSPEATHPELMPRDAPGCLGTAAARCLQVCVRRCGLALRKGSGVGLEGRAWNLPATLR